jgi:hypothetical protein
MHGRLMINNLGWNEERTVGLALGTTSDRRHSAQLARVTVAAGICNGFLEKSHCLVCC